MAPLTKWEIEQIGRIDKCLNSAKITVILIQMHHKFLYVGSLEPDDFPRVEIWQRWRRFTTNLYEILHLLCRLNYCHFQNNGQLSDAAQKVRFPNLTHIGGQHEAFVKGQFQNIFGEGADLTGDLFQKFEEFMSGLLQTEQKRLFNVLHGAATVGGTHDISELVCVSPTPAIEVRVLDPGGETKLQPQVGMASELLGFVQNARVELLKLGLGNQYVPFCKLVDGSGLGDDFKIVQQELRSGEVETITMKLNINEFIRKYETIQKIKQKLLGI